MKLALALLLATSANVASFSPNRQASAASNAPTQGSSSTLRVHTSGDKDIAKTTRRKWLSSVMISTFVLAGPTQPAGAAVQFDPDRYGDKELKVAFVTKLRQNIRDAIIEQPSLAPQFLEIIIQDSLTFNALTGEGGPDGSIVKAILTSSPDSALFPLQPGAKALVDLQQKVKRTTEVTMADVVTFAGAEAIESSGGPRVGAGVQLGKLDPKMSFTAPFYPDLNNANQAMSAFTNAGLNARDAALIFGALASMKQVAVSQPTVEAKEEEQNEMGDPSVTIPTSFGAPGEIYGAKLVGKMDASVFEEVVKQNKLPHPVFADERVSEWAAKYASKKESFDKDLPQAYNRLYRR